VNTEMDAIPLDFFFVLHNFPWWSVTTHSRFKLMRWDSLLTYDFKFCMTNHLSKTSNFVLLQGCGLIAWGWMKYIDTGNLADRLLYLASEICLVTYRNLHVIILQTLEIHYAKRECYSQSLVFSSCTCYVTQFHKLFCYAPVFRIPSAT
jgi:hypothetical protein